MDDRPHNLDEIMENQTAFDLNAAIRDWRQNLAQASSFRADDLEELESHLRDSVQDLEKRDLTSQEAFLVAARRVGAGAPLAAEFSRINMHAVWIDRILWMLVGYVLVISTLSSPGALELGLMVARGHYLASWVYSPLWLLTFLMVYPLILALLFVRSLLRSGSMSSLITGLLKKPLRLSIAFFLLGLLPDSLRLWSLSRMSRGVSLDPSPIVIRSIVAAFLIWILARKRLQLGTTDRLIRD